MCFRWVGRPRVAPVLGREVVEGEEDVAVLRETAACPLVLRPVLLQEVVEGLGRHLPGFGEPDLVKIALGLGKESLGHLVGVRTPQPPLQPLIASVGGPLPSIAEAGHGARRGSKEAGRVAATAGKV